MAVDNVGIVRRVMEEVWNKGNFAVLDELLADNYVTHGPLIGDANGRSAAKNEATMYRTAYPDLILTIDEIVSAGDRVLVRWTGRGTHKGSFMGVAPTNRKGVVHGMTLSRLQGGKIVEEHTTFDTLALFQSMGLVAPIDQLMKGAAPQPTARA
jgi:steroid delta-isomerase-like uncharacterized protein